MKLKVCIAVESLDLLVFNIRIRLIQILTKGKERFYSILNVNERFIQF